MVENSQSQSNTASSKLDDFTLTRTLGTGFSAKVKLATDSQGKQFAIKIFYHDNP